MKLLNTASQSHLHSPSDLVIGQIKEMISSGVLKPGDRLPSERQLAEQLGVSRTHLRSALRKLEFYGILKTYPQSGTVVAGLGLPALTGLITDMLSLHNTDFKSLVETRVILEANAAMLAASNRSDQDLVELATALQAHKRKVERNESAVEEDLLFHLKIAEASKNSVLKSLMLLITPDIMEYFTSHNVCGGGRSNKAVLQHEELLQYITDGNSAAAGDLLRDHLNDIVVYVNEMDVDLQRSA